MNDLEFLQNWYSSQCNGDWEHQLGIRIETLDNPGWQIVIDLAETEADTIVIDENLSVSDNEWFYMNVKDKKLICAGDNNKLNYLLKRIREILTNSTYPTPQP